MASNNDEGALWSIMGYLVAGLLIWGGIGFALDHWFHTHHYFFLGGLILGAGSSIYLVWLRFGRR